MLRKFPPLLSRLTANDQTCGGVGHISRECPSGGGGGGQRAFGGAGGFGGPKKCYVSIQRLHR